MHAFDYRNKINLVSVDFVADAQHTEDVRQVNNNQQGDEPGEPEQDGERGEQEGEGQPGPSDETEVSTASLHSRKRSTCT